MAVFKREKFDKKGILKDVTSIAGLVDKTAKKLNFGDVLAYDTGTKKWKKYEKATHNTGLFLLGVVKEEIDVTEADTTIAILTQGEIAKADVEAVKNDELLWSLLAKQGIYVL